MTAASVSSPTAISTILRRAIPADRAAVEELLATNELPIQGVGEALDHFVIAELRGALVGAIGLEMYGDASLLRSAVVQQTARGTGLGVQLVDAILQHAAQAGVHEVYLLTTTAERYFPRFGFQVIARDDVPESVRQSVEFRGACPASAIVMRRSLK